MENRGTTLREISWCARESSFSLNRRPPYYDGGAFLIGNVNELRGDCDDCTAFRQDQIVNWYDDSMCEMVDKIKRGANGMKNFGLVYRDVLEDVMSRGTVETNRRTNTQIRMLPEGISFALHLNDNILPTCGLRRTKPWHAAAEAAWCLLGHDDTTWLRKYTKVWEPFCDDRGKLPQAYGARWLHAFSDIMEEIPCNQIEEAMERLGDDHSDRRIWITSYHPVEDLVKTGQKTVPCPVGFSLSIMDGQLCSSLMIRSSDLYFGLPYDVMRHAFLMAAFASTLGIGLGFMRVTLAHAHVYRPQWANVTAMLNNTVACPRIYLPIAAIDFITHNPDDYVELVKTRCDSLREEYWPSYSPKNVEVVR